MEEREPATAWAGGLQCAGGVEADDILIASQSGANGMAFFFFFWALPNETASAGGPKLPRAGDQVKMTSCSSGTITVSTPVYFIR